MNSEPLADRAELYIREITNMRLYLHAILEMRGRFSKDRLEHAHNCIEHARNLAQAALHHKPFAEFRVEI